MSAGALSAGHDLNVEKDGAQVWGAGLRAQALVWVSSVGFRVATSLGSM